MSGAQKLQDYPVFEGISDEDLKILLPCLNAGFMVLRTGDELNMESGRVGMITEGSLVSASGEQFRSGDLLTCENASGLTAAADTAILRLDREMVFSPCWFSCSFHHRVAESINIRI